MGNQIQVGNVIHGFEIIESRPLEELKATGVLARHVASGAEVFHLVNDDDENLFAFAFATPSSDSTGAAHILEHSVLCGSERHPLKDAFIVLAQGSLQTFLNAMTFPDKTVYPASSVNERDYFNLMSVYGDAVFSPLLAEWTFHQEGRRYEPKEDGSLSLTGVVYNEMKGNYSSMDSIAGDWAFRAVFPGTVYDHDSGGDPDEIPSLSWERLKAFHKLRYTAANCRVFLCGNIPTEKQLAFLEERFFSTAAKGERATPIPKAARWTEPRTLRERYPAGPDGKSTVMLSWLCGDSTDPAETLSLAVLVEALLGHDGSPLARALVQSRLGEDLASACGLEGELRETVITAGLRGCAATDAGKVEDLIMKTLARLAEDGVPAEDVEAALRTLEFSNREIRRSGGPFSLSWLRRSLRGWLHGGKPWDTLLFAGPLAAFKASLAAEPRLLENMIRLYLLDNAHRALVIVEPDTGMGERKEKELAEFLLGEKERLGEEGLAACRAAAAELARVQGEADSAEALATIPHLARADLSREVEIIPRELSDRGGVPLVSHELFTNGVAYVDLAFPIDVLVPEDYPYLTLLSRVAVASGLPGLDYGETSSLLARTTGGFHSVLQTSSLAPGAARAIATPSGVLDLGGRDWLVFRLKALDEKLEEGLDLALRLIREADFSDTRRLTDLVLELRNDFDSSLAPGGHSYAMSRTGRRFSRSRAVDEVLGGIVQLEFAHALPEADIKAISARLIAIRDAVCVRGGCVANVTGSAEVIERAGCFVAGRFAGIGAPRPRNAAGEGAEAFFALADGGVDGSADGGAGRGGAGRSGKSGEVLSSATLQVGFAALSMDAAPFATKEQAAELALAHRLSTGALWEDIRMKGGAYGAFAFPDGLEPVFTFATYRDPSPSRSLDSFRTALGAAAAERIDDEELEKCIIGTYAKETRPRAPAEKGMADFMRLLCGIDAGARKRKLSAIVDLRSEDLAAAAARLAEGPGRTAIVAPATEASRIAAASGATVRNLPL